MVATQRASATQKSPGDTMGSAMTALAPAMQRGVRMSFDGPGAGVPGADPCAAVVLQAPAPTLAPARPRPATLGRSQPNLAQIGANSVEFGRHRQN